MRISTGFNPYAYRQQTVKKDTCETFGDILVNVAKAKNGGASKESTASTRVTAVSNQTAKSSIDWNRTEEIARRFYDTGNKVQGIDTTRKLNEESKGDQELTVDQIAQLKEKYDVENMSTQERYDMYCDLTDMGVLSVRDIMLGSVGTSPISTTTVVKQGSGMNTYNIPGSNIYALRQAELKDAQFGYDYILKLMEQPDLDNSPWDKENIDNYLKRLPLIEHARAANEKVFSILSQFVRDK